LSCTLSVARAPPQRRTANALKMHAEGVVRELGIRQAVEGHADAAAVREA
jgi:hypothetical protein